MMPNKLDFIHVAQMYSWVDSLIHEYEELTLTKLSESKYLIHLQGKGGCHHCIPVTIHDCSNKVSRLGDEYTYEQKVERHDHIRSAMDVVEARVFLDNKTVTVVPYPQSGCYDVIYNSVERCRGDVK